jgi:hypothetical protein
VTDVANCGSQEIAPLILRPRQYQIDEALARLCNQVRQIDLVVSSSVNVLPCNRLSRVATTVSAGLAGNPVDVG